MNRFFLLLLCVSVAGCGVKRPLMRPSEIPAYEAKRAEKKAKIRAERAADGGHHSALSEKE